MYVCVIWRGDVCIDMVIIITSKYPPHSGNWGLYIILIQKNKLI